MCLHARPGQDLREEHGRKYCNYFGNVKLGYSYESYLDQIAQITPYLYTLARFRLGAHNLAIERGAWRGKSRTERCCTIIVCDG